ncbi:MAG: hypothetical protein AAFX46_08375 [Cyanobacteria bacterium J06636_27]
MEKYKYAFRARFANVNPKSEKPLNLFMGTILRMSLSPSRTTFGTDTLRRPQIQNPKLIEKFFPMI